MKQSITTMQDVKRAPELPVSTPTEQIVTNSTVNGKACRWPGLFVLLVKLTLV